MPVKELSPAAQAVFDAYLNAPCGKPRETWVAAVLRAAADQMAAHHSKAFLYSIADGLKLHAIADELEAQ